MNIENIVPLESVGQKIFVVRGVKVMLDADLASLYQVPTKRLNEQVKRNKSRFPPDFMFPLNPNEVLSLNRSHFATSSNKHRDLNIAPYVFTEHGVVMLASVLKSPRAVQMSLFIVRAFVKLRELLATNKDLASRIEDLENKQEKQGEHITEIHDLLKSLSEPQEKPKRDIGFNKN